MSRGAFGGMTMAVSDADPHLGGNIIEGDILTHCPAVWRYCVERFAVKSVLDVGSGRGHAALFMSRLGVPVVAIDGLMENVFHAVYPTVYHDLTKGPFITAVDLVHCQEVAEHIPEDKVEFLIDTFKAADIVVMTHAVPGQLGHHHVNCQTDEYWVSLMRNAGYFLLVDDTARIRRLALIEGAAHMANSGLVFSRKS